MRCIGVQVDGSDWYYIYESVGYDSNGVLNVLREYVLWV